MRHFLFGIMSLLLIRPAPAVDYAGDATDMLSVTFTALEYKNRNAISSLRMSHAGLMAEKAQLLNRVGFSVVPSLIVNSSVFSRRESPAEPFTVPLSGNLDISEWNVFYDGNFFKQGGVNTMGVLAPMVSSTREKARLLDSLIALEQLKAYFHIEALFLQELKNLWAIIIDIMRLEDELEIRRQLDSRIEQTAKFLDNFIRAGQINKRSIRLFNLVFEENRMRLTIGAKRVAVLRVELMNLFFIGTQHVDEVVEENRKLLTDLARKSDSKRLDVVPATIAEMIDSLTLRSTILRQQLDTRTEYSLKIGPVVSAPQDRDGLSFGGGIRFSIDFLRKKQRDLKTPPSPQETGRQTANIDLLYSDDSVVLEKYVEEAEREATNIVEELKSGNQYSLPWLNDLYSRIISARIDWLELRYSYLRSTVSVQQSLESLNLRKQLMHRFPAWSN